MRKSNITSHKSHLFTNILISLLVSIVAAMLFYCIADDSILPIMLSIVGFIVSNIFMLGYLKHLK